MKSVALGFSGGVDSAVCAVLLKRAGYDVLGIYLDNSDEASRSIALSAAEFIGIPLEIKDVHKELEEKVCLEFERSYMRGETPNPCIICNPLVKFKNLLEYGTDYIATGHYAKAFEGSIYKGHPENDQSYMLCRLTPLQASRLLLPLGAYPKSDVRKMAEDFSLPVASRPDSMEICFIPENNYSAWLTERLGSEKSFGGNFILHGEVVGQHSGFFRYTVGQRIPGLFNGRKAYVSKINPQSGVIELALWEELFKTEVFAADFNYLCSMPAEFEASVKVRHTKWENPKCRVYKQGSCVKIVCEEPVRAPAAGQSAVLYEDDKLIGGGFISSACLF